MPKKIDAAVKERALRMFADHRRDYASDTALAEISAPGVTKASGVAALARRQGVGPEDVVVFGDMPNDIALFDWVREGGGRAVAMAHAHPDVLAAATDVTGTNEEDGVAAFLAAL